MSTVLTDSLQFQMTKTMVEFGVYKDGRGKVTTNEGSEALLATVT